MAPVRPVRPRELQDWLNRRIYHPLAWQLALCLSRTRVSPNMVSVAGASLVVAAAIAYVQPFAPWAALVGLLLHLSWHVVDGADGDLARLTGRSGPKGELVDGICDYASHVVLYLVLGWHLQGQVGPIAWLPTLGAGFSRIVQANQYEVARRQYQWWAYGIPWLRQERGPVSASGTGAAGALGSVYLSLAARLAPQAQKVDAALAEVVPDPIATQRIHVAVRGLAGHLLARVPLLGANYRTVMLGVSMLAGSPLYYFVYEAVVLNFVLARSIVRADAGAGRVMELIGRDGVASTAR